MLKIAHVAAAALAALTGTLHDNTTGQPLVGVAVTAGSGTHAQTARTDTNGRFVLRHLAPGTYTLHFSSKDVPAQSARVRVRGGMVHVDLRACSMTLDYSCAGSNGGPGGGS